MICLETVKKFCTEYWLIENYDQAVADESQTWCCHHRREIEYNLSRIELQALGFYFNRPFAELIFLTPEEHKRLHRKGKRHTEESKAKMSAARKGKEAPNKGKHLTEEWKQRLSVVKKGTHHTEESKQKMSDAKTKFHISVEELYDLYVVQGLSTYKIAELYGCSDTCIYRKLKKFNIRKK